MPDPSETPDHNKKRVRRLRFKVVRAQNLRTEFAAAAFRDAILYPLFKPKPKQYETKLFIASQTEQLIELRRQRFAELRKLVPSLVGANPAFSDNCPPFGVFTDQRSRPCKLDHLCPFCWARGIMTPILKRIMRMFLLKRKVAVASQDVANQQLDLPAPRILELTSHLEYEPDISLSRILKYESRFVRLGRNGDPNNSPFYGSVASLSATPSERYPKSWRITRRRLILIPAKEYVSEKIDLSEIMPSFPDAQKKVTTCTLSGHVMNAITRGIGYPLWLLTGDPKRVAEWLKARRGLRLLNKNGVLRG